MPNFREVRIPGIDLKNLYPVLLKRYLLGKGFYHEDRVVKLRSFKTMETIFRQEITPKSLIFKKFNRHYEYPWQKYKRLIFKKM